MRLSNAWEKLKPFALGAFGIAFLAHSAYEIYCAITLGTVEVLSRHSGDWITFSGNPILYVLSLSAYALFCALGLAVLGAWLFGLFGGPRRWRSREDIDNAIRLDVGSR